MLKVAALHPTIPTYGSWKASCVNHWHSSQGTISCTAKKLLRASASDLETPLCRLKSEAHQLQMSPLQRIIAKIIQYVAHWLPALRSDFYQKMLDFDLKGRRLVALADWIAKEQDEQAINLAKKQLLCLTSWEDPVQINSIYSDAIFAGELAKVCRELKAWIKLPEEEARVKQLSPLLTQRLAGILNRSNKAQFAKKLTETSQITPTIWTAISQKNGDEESLLTALLEEESFFLENVRDGYSQAEKFGTQTPTFAFTQKMAQLRQAYNEQDGVVDTSLEWVTGAKTLPDSQSATSAISVIHVGVEYGLLWKQGGLAEAIQGIVEGQKKLNPQGKIQVLFPFYNVIRPHVKALGVTLIEKEYKSASGEAYKTATFVHQGIEFILIDHPSFGLLQTAGSTSVYSGGTKARIRFADFCKFASQWIYENRKTIDIVHLHDWHVGSIVDNLRKSHILEWNSGELPATFFTFHNNTRPAAQGGVSDEEGVYTYGLDMNPMLTALRHSDMVSTVSPRFSQEVQTPMFSEGVHGVMQVVAAQKRLLGILNASSPERYNPETDAALKSWKLNEKSQPVDLSYGPGSSVEEIIAKQKLAKTCLAQWVQAQRLQTHKYLLALGKIDPERPIMMFLGRYDTEQKGLRDFGSIIEVCLKNGIQPVFVGSQEDPAATVILDELAKKYSTTDGVVILRDYRFENNQFRYQQGSSLNSPIKSVIMAAADSMIVPSMFEPCGLVQFEAWLYGMLVFARECGGLADTVKTLKVTDSTHFNGWLFKEMKTGVDSFEQVVGHAIEHLSQMTSAERAQLRCRLIQQARLQNWTYSEGALAPVSQYFIAYDESLKRRFKRERVIEYRLQDMAGRIDTQKMWFGGKPSKPSDLVESAYAKAWFLRQGDVQTYESHKEIMGMYPDPYGQACRTDLHKEFGPQLLKDGVFSLKMHAPAADTVEILLYDEAFSLSGSYPMVRQLDGTWVIQITAPPGTAYRVRINGEIKMDPFARQWLRPNYSEPAFCVMQSDQYTWSDQAWMNKREENNQLSQARIYEIHPATWGAWFTSKDITCWSALAKPLIEHMKKCDFSHVELMAIFAHPYFHSFGYQVGSYYALDERMGGPTEFKKLVDEIHHAGLGVIFDFVPGHFSVDSWALGQFDGTPKFETSGLKRISIQSVIFNWGHQMDLADPWNVDFLLSSLKMFFEDYHFDGVRVDGVKSMLYHYNPQAAKSFLRHLNQVVEQEAPHCFVIAEDLSDNNLSVEPICTGGLGFRGRWNPAWKELGMKALRTLPSSREHGGIKGQMVQFLHSIKDQNNELLYLSHDEFKPGVPTLLELGKESLSLEQRVAQVKVLLAHQRLLPVPSLQFMGTENFTTKGWEMIHPSTLESVKPKDSTPACDMESIHVQEFYAGLATVREVVGNIQKITGINATLFEGLAYAYEIKGSKKNATVYVNLTQEKLSLPMTSGELLFDTSHMDVRTLTAKEGASTPLPPFSLMVKLKEL